MIVMIALGLVPVVLVFLLLTYFAALAAKKRGKNPWLWGIISVVVLTTLSWQQLPKWTGYINALEMYPIHFVTQQWQAANIKPRDPNAVDQFTLQTRQNTYTFNIPARYQADHPTPDLIRLMLKYPSMTEDGAPSEVGLGNGVISVYISTYTGNVSWAQHLLNQVSENKEIRKYAGREGSYEIYQAKNPIDATTEITRVFTAKDGQLVLVEPEVNDAKEIHRNIGSDLVVMYGFFPAVGNDFVKIDEVVIDFIKAHLKLQSIQNKETVK